MYPDHCKTDIERARACLADALRHIDDGATADSADGTNRESFRAMCAAMDAARNLGYVNHSTAVMAGAEIANRGRK